jgi:F-type H+-transporting ATPase subunit b
MSELISSLGVDWRLFIAQLINFSILLFVLHRFAYKPVLKMLENRTEKIEKGLQDAEASQKKLEQAAKKEEELLIEAKKQAKEIIEKAQEQANLNRDEILVQTKKDSERIIAHAQKVSEEQKEKMVNEVKSEVAGLVAIALEKIIDEKMDSHKDMQIINNVLNAK